MHDSTNPGHALPKSTVIGSYIALLFFTAVMVGLSRIDVDRFAIDWLNLHAIRTALIMGSALIMGVIVSMFLMGLRYESKLLNLTIFLSNFVFLLIFVLFTWVDTSFRGEVDPTFNEKINWTSPVKPSEGAGHGAAAPAHQGASEAPAAAHPAQPGDSVVPQDAAAEAKKSASGTAPANPAQATPENPAQPAQPAKEAAPAKNPPSPQPAAPKAAPAGH